MSSQVSVAALQAMKREGRKIVGIVAWDCQMAAIADRAGADIVSVGDTVGVNLWGRDNPLEVTMDEMMIVARAVRRGVRRALVSVDFPYGPLQQGPDAALAAAIRFVKEAGVDMVKLDGAADFPEAVSAITQAGIPVFAQFGITPHTALKHGIDYATAVKAGFEPSDTVARQLVDDARRLEAAGAALLDFTHSGPVAGPQVVAAVSVPVIGGLGGGPWLDGRMRMANAAIGYAASTLDNPPDTYAQTARMALDALTQLCADVRDGRQIRGGIPLRRS